MTKDQQRYLECVKSLDDIQLGMLWPSIAVKEPEKVRDQCAANGWIDVVDENHPSGDAVVYLTTRGKRLLDKYLHAE